MAGGCPYCKAPSLYESRWEQQHRCGTFQPIDGPTTRSEQCKERETQQKASEQTLEPLNGSEEA